MSNYVTCASTALNTTRHIPRHQTTMNTDRSVPSQARASSPRAMQPSPLEFISATNVHHGSLFNASGSKSLSAVRKLYHKLSNQVADDARKGVLNSDAAKRFDQMRVLLASLEETNPEVHAGWSRHMLGARSLVIDPSTQAHIMMSQSIPPSEPVSVSSVDVELDNERTVNNAIPEEVVEEVISSSPKKSNLFVDCNQNFAKPHSVGSKKGILDLSSEKFESLLQRFVEQTNLEVSNATDILDNQVMAQAPEVQVGIPVKQNKSNAFLQSKIRRTNTLDAEKFRISGSRIPVHHSSQQSRDDSDSDEEWERHLNSSMAADSLAAGLTGDQNDKHAEAEEDPDQKLVDAMDQEDAKRRPWFLACPPFDQCNKRSWRLRRRSMHAMFEHPSASNFGLFMMYFSVLMVLISIASMVLETEPSLNGWKGWSTIEEVCVIYFTIEYLLRLFSTPRTAFQFITQSLNIFDLASILPYYVFLMIGENSDNSSSFLIIRILRVFRVFRISRYVSWFTILGNALYESGIPLLMMMFVLLIIAIFFSAVIYFVERGEYDVVRGLYINAYGQISSFQSIPDAMWFVFTSFTTVGYGDNTPITTLGKVVAGATCVLGVLVISIPVSVVSQNFANEFEAHDRAKFLIRLRLNAVLSVAPRPKMRPLTVYRADKLDANQLKVLHAKFADKISHEIDRMLEADATWMTELELLLKRDQAQTFKHLRHLVAQQLNGDLWSA